MAATLVFPAGSITSAQPAYTWNAVLDSAQGDAATWYYLWVNRVNGDGSQTVVHNTWYQSSAACGSTTCSITADVTLTAGNYLWWIQTWNATGFGPWSSAMNFSTSGATSTPTQTATDTPLPTLTFTPTFTPTASQTPTAIPAGPLTIDYTYDALNRLTGATYSDGRNFAYTYDSSGNVLELEQNLGPGTIITTYTYDAANQLDTAQQGDPSTGSGQAWQYTYDANGSLISDGVKTYTYDAANRLIQVNDQSFVTNLSYNGLGQRLSMDAAGVIAHYVMDGDQPLTAESSGNTTFYLYGLGAIGEKTNTWSYSLPDGTNTPRQLSNLSGEITLSARYTPWGDTLELNGTGNFTFGYFGGVMNAATGLLYVGNGQYYDPGTGRFLTRDAKPNNSNPYVPSDPRGASSSRQKLLIANVIVVRSSFGSSRVLFSSI